MWEGGIDSLSSLLCSAKLKLRMKVLKHFHFYLQKNNSAVFVLPTFPISMPKWLSQRVVRRMGSSLATLEFGGSSSPLYILVTLYHRHFFSFFLEGLQNYKETSKIYIPLSSLFSPGPRAGP